MATGTQPSTSPSPGAEASDDARGPAMPLSTPAIPLDASTMDPASQKAPADGHLSSQDDDMGSPRNVVSKQTQMEAELRQLRATLSSMAKKQAELETRDQEFEETPFSMTDEHRFALQHRRYYADSSESDDDDYTQFDQRRRQMERVFVRELKIIKREKDMIQSIRSLRRDRDILLEKERAWERERLALEKIQKQQAADAVAAARPSEEDTQLMPGDDAASAATQDTETAQLEEPEATTQGPPVYALPKLNYVEWHVFKAFRENAEHDSYAIDVLKGEPVVTFDYPGYLWPKKLRHNRGKVEEIAKSKAASNARHKQLTVPERIRIHSYPIQKILDGVSGETLSSGGPVVMIRPFKFLVYYQEQIRQKFHELEAKFGGHARVAGDASVAAVSTVTDPPEDADAAGPEKAEVSMRRASTIGLEAQGEEEPDKQTSDEADITASAVAYEHLQCLIEFMDTRLQPKFKSLASGDCKIVSFHDLWYLFKPGDEVLDQGRKQAYRVLEVTSVCHKVIPPWRNYFDKSSRESEETPVRLHCVYVDFDGKVLGPVSRIFEIPRFDGERAITSLEVYPLHFAETDGGRAFRKKLIERGRMFLDVAGVKHMHYNGLTLGARDEVDSQVVVDFEEAFVAKGNSNWRPNVERLIGESKLPEDDDEACRAECCRAENIHKDGSAERKRSRDYMGSLIPEDRNREPSVAIYTRSLKDKNALSEDELLIMSYRVFGFVLRSRKWAELDLTYLSPIKSVGGLDSNAEAGDVDDNSQKEKDLDEEGSAFDQLVLPPGHKRMILSLIAQHYRDKESGDTDTDQVDIVRGKGKGLIILLHGAPGVGKTTTAEGMAELFGKPLFQITCGDLGTTASEVEIALETNFALANRWGCILLLDEADVFLTTRSPADFVRNGLVAVFLRVLEYYAGILFLTTNRIGDFDEAFASRVHISLHYPQLDSESTEEIFKLNLRLIKKRFQKKGREIKIDEAGILKFATDYWTMYEKQRWNGRQIRNGCQTALALAEFDAQGGSHERIKNANAEVKLGVDHLEIVSGAYLDFISYLTKVYGKDADRRAKAMAIRARETYSKKDEVKDATGSDTASKDGARHAFTSSTSLGVRATLPPGINPAASPEGIPVPVTDPLSAGHSLPYGQYHPQQFAQPPNTSQPGSAGITPQTAAGQMPNVNLAPGQYMWQGWNSTGSWPASQQPMPGQGPGQYGGFPTAEAWAAMSAQQQGAGVPPPAPRT